MMMIILMIIIKHVSNIPIASQDKVSLLLKQRLTSCAKPSAAVRVENFLQAGTGNALNLHKVFKNDGEKPPTLFLERR